MNLKGGRESTNFEDRTAAPWYSPDKMLTAVMIEMNRMIGSKKQAYLDEVQKTRDANPLNVTPEQERANYNAKVSRDPNGKGWTIKREGAPFDEYAPDYVDSGVIQSILKQSGIAK